MDDLIGFAATRIFSELRHFTADSQKAILKRVAALVGGPSIGPVSSSSHLPQPIAVAHNEDAPAPRERLGKEALADLEARILTYVLGKQGASAGTISLALDVKQTSVSNLLGKLTKSGQIRRQGDRRSAVYLAPESKP